ncbi:MAG: hypothetical protein ACK55Z_03405, partial [bacterium]
MSGEYEVSTVDVLPVDGQSESGQDFHDSSSNLSGRKQQFKIHSSIESFSPHLLGTKDQYPSRSYT